MTINAFEIPLSPSPQKFRVTLNDVEYTMTLTYRPDPAAGWTLDIGDTFNTPLASGIPLVTGADLLAQYSYLNIGGGLAVVSDGVPDAVPDFNSLGVTSHLYFVVTT